VGLEVVWDNNEQTVVRFIFEGNWTWEDFHTAIKIGTVMMDTVSHSVISIIDLRASKFLPANPMRHLRQMVSDCRKHNNASMIVFIGADDFVQAICYATRRIYLDVRAFSEFHFVDTLDEARVLSRNLHRKLVGDPFSDTQPIF
jgi:hypothetical protein